MKNSWFQNGSEYHYGEVSNQIDKLPVGIYSLREMPMSGELYLYRMDNEFKFNHKIYGVEEAFINRVDKTYNSVNDNLGILLNGIRGTGKSVTSKLICNKLNLPIIMVDSKYSNFVQFVSELQQNTVIFIDEYEKIYSESDELLTVMDGLFKTEYKHVFLLTTNDLYINRNLLQRPGRIRYIKTYSDMSAELVEEIIDDLLIYPEYKEDCITVISKLNIITIDLVKSIVNEVNIHNQKASEFINIFNVKPPNDYDYQYPYNFHLIKENNIVSDELYLENFQMPSLENLKVGYNLYNELHEYKGRIIDVYPNNIYKIRMGYKLCKDNPYNDEGNLKYDENSIIQKDGKFYLVTNASKCDLNIDFLVKIVEIEKLHNNFKRIL